MAEFEITHIEPFKVDLSQLDNNMEKGIRRGFFVVGHLLIKTARSQMAEKPKSGRLYKIKGRKHRASAPGESPANITRALSRSLGFQIGNLSMQFGAGGRGSGVNYASYLENKLDRPLLQNAVEKNEGSIEHIFQSTLSSFITKGS